MKKQSAKEVQWSTPQILHKDCLEWASQLLFIKDEQRFLNELIKDYTIPLISAEMYRTSQAIVGDLVKEEKELSALLKRVEEHSNSISEKLNSKHEESEGEANRISHNDLKLKVYNYAQQYRDTKEELFKRIKNIMRRDKSKRLKE